MDGQTDMKLTVAFRNFANAPEKGKWYFKTLFLQLEHEHTTAVLQKTGVGYMLKARRKFKMIHSVAIQAHTGYLGRTGVMSQQSTETQIHWRPINSAFRTTDKLQAE